jgi:hypothetical protein
MIDRAGRRPGPLCLLLLALGASAGLAGGRLPAQEDFKVYPYKIDPKTPAIDLLPDPPKVKNPLAPVVGDDLRQVPEVEFREAPPKKLTRAQAVHWIAYQAAKINLLNGREEDGFIKALRSDRPDLAGLPFALGDACRTKGERSRYFGCVVQGMRELMPEMQLGKADRNRSADSNAEKRDAAAFWETYQMLHDRVEKSLARAKQEDREHLTLASVAALMQILAPESAAVRVGLVERLAKISHPEASRAIAKLALFSPEEEVRNAAVNALKKRRDAEVVPVLLSGLRYPWPAVAGHAAEALVRLKRTDLMPQLIEVLEAPDPRAPALKEVDGEKVLVVRELVKLNHHRSCLLCHAPDNGKESQDALKGAIPLPSEKFPSRAVEYRMDRPPELTVRVDVTYLRQDFSVYQEVKDAAPWPKMQRFDFLVRQRVLTNAEAVAYRKALANGERGQPSPYQRAALSALRGLTGKDAGPDPDAWRKLLPPLKLEAEAPPS